jgi:UDP-N-acetylmuramoyl-L-alanyl-D-glutamate--2,6-diaminopimelate ligase
MIERRTTTLAELARAGDGLVLEMIGDAEVTGVAYDSRGVQPGDLFFCVPGSRADGHEYATAAAEAGASALCVERSTGTGLPELRVADARAAMAILSAAFYGNPARDLTLLGVTGTNGKTTTAYLLESIMRAAGKTTGLIGTIETRVGDDHRPGVRTTPESLDLHALFAEMRDAGVDSVAMEVTSHALALGRVEGLRYAAAGFTNLSQDHLDFHADMEDYFEAKRSLFRPDRLDRGAVNVDDPYGRKLFETVEVPCVAFGHADNADVRAENVVLRPDGSDFDLVTSSGTRRLSVTLAGAFNVYNCLAAAAIALQAGLSLDAVVNGLASISSVPGRFESISRGQPFAVVVDYAHTPDSLDNVLKAARRLAETQGSLGRVLCVFGCGGDRDRGKRPLMGAVAAQLADYVVVTSDNPRSEDPVAIIDEILEGVVAHRPQGPDAVLPDRREAIAEALGEARPGDVVVIAGKGHETGQQFATVTHPFDDRDVAAEMLDGLGWRPSA